MAFTAPGECFIAVIDSAPQACSINQMGFMDTSAKSEHDIIAFLRLVWSAKLYIAACVCITLLLGMIALHILPHRYRAEAVIMPPESERNNGNLSQLGGLASLALSGAGGGLAGQSNTSFLSFLETLGSHKLSEELQQNSRILQIVYSQQWDPVRNMWKPESMTGGIGATLKFLVTAQHGQSIDTYQLDGYLADHLAYTQIPQTPFYGIAFTYKNRDEGQKILSMILSSADSIVRDAKLNRAKQQIAYLENKLREVTVEQHREALTTLLLEQERTVMLSQSGASFSFQLVRPIASPPEASWPNAAAVLGIFGLLGVVSGLALYLRRNAVQPSWMPMARAKFVSGNT